MRRIGYARVSTEDQRPHLQIDALRRAGVRKADIFTEHVSGAKATRDRLVLQEAMCACATGDTLYVWKLDRLGRSVLKLIEITTALSARGD